MYQRILIVIDDEAKSEVAIAEGLALARCHDAEVIFFHVLPRYVMPVTELTFTDLPTPDEFQRATRLDAQRRLNEATAAAERVGVRSLQAMGSGVDDAECIVQAASDRGCELIVVASTGRNAVMRLLSESVIPGLITRSMIPVLVCRKTSPGSRIERLASAERRRRRTRAGIQQAMSPDDTPAADTGRPHEND